MTKSAKRRPIVVSMVSILTGVFISVLLLTACKNPLVGLGPRVDLTPPEGTITGIVSGDYVRGIIQLTGTIQDDKETAAVWALTNGFKDNGIIHPDGTWEIEIDTDLSDRYGGDGEKNITIGLEDRDGKITEKQMLLTFDNTPPVLLVKAPVGYASNIYSDVVISIKGEAADPYRIRKINVELIGGSGTLDPVVGTNSWSSVFHSAGTGTYTFNVIAEDYAGNRSSHFFHYDDVVVANDDVFITPEELYDIENGVDSLHLTTAELTTLELISLPISISMDIDNPVITISNPDPTKSASENVFSLNAKFLGTVEDDDGVNTTTFPPQISIDGGPWISVQTVTGSGLFVRWEHNRTFLLGDAGDHTVKIKATDIYGVEIESPAASFRIDAGAPEVTIDAPQMSDYLNTPSFTISGTAAAANDITDIEVSTDNGSSWDVVTFAPATSVNWSYVTGVLTPGIKPIKTRASTDNGGNWSYANIQITIDTQAPTGNFTSPVIGSYVNGIVDIKGTSSDNNLLSSVEIKVGDDRAWQPIPDTEKYNWTYTIDSADYENSTDGTETFPGSGAYRINVYFRITDIAGNITSSALNDHYFIINNSLDSPTVTIISPQDGASLGGSVIVSGTSFDDDGAVPVVYMQIDVNTAPGGTPNFADMVDLSPHSIDFDGVGGNPPVVIVNESILYALSGVSPWSVDLNTFGELYDTDGAGPHNGDIHIRVSAEDINGLAGSYVQHHFRLDDTIPLITGLLPASESYVKGTFPLTGTVSDETQIRHLEISYDGGSTNRYIIQNGVVQAPYGSGPVTDTYPLNLSIDTSAIPDVGNVSSDDVTFRLRVTDNTNYQSEKTLVYYVDNTLPSGWMTQDTSDIYGNASNAVLSGYADDIGAVSGVNKIVAYFEKDGNFYNPRNGDSTAVTNEIINGVSVPYPSGVDAVYQLVIDNRSETLSGDNSDGDGIAEELNMGIYQEWKIRIESTNIPDGISKFHYVVFDNANNKAHYTQDVFVKNDKPIINEIKVGYDLDNNGTVEGGEIFSYGGIFKARNKLYFEFDAVDGGGIIDYAVYEGTDSSGDKVVSAQSGQFDISLSPDGPVSYFCQVIDADGITAESLILVDIDNEDDVAPSISLAPFSSADVVFTGVVSGHLEAAGASLHNGPDADISGKIKLHGTAADDQGIQEIRLEIDGVSHTLAGWSGGFFVSLDANFVIDTQDIDPINGHQITWTYNWDSASISTVAKNDVDILFTVNDFGSGPNQDTSNRTVDVVPYISRIRTSITNSFSDAFARTSLGEYPVRINTVAGTYETITVYGYNLRPQITGALSDVRLSLDPDGIDGVTKKGIGLSYANLAADYTSVDVNLHRGAGGAVTGNGYLNIFTSGIPTINNINDNAVNSEADYINPNLTDDRYLSVWNLNLLKNQFPLAANAVYPGMSMNGNTPEFSYQNNAQGWGIALHLDGTTEKKVYENWDLFTFSAIDHNRSGNNALLYDINVVNGNYGDYNSGNYGGILTKFFYDVPATSWNFWAYRFNHHQVWLENLVDENGVTTAVLGRYQNPDLFTVGTTADTSVFYTVYDSLRDKIVFRTFKVGTNASIGTAPGGRINNSGTALYTSIAQHESDGGGSFPEYDGSDRRFITSSHAGKTPAGQQLIDNVYTGQYTAVAATADGSTAVVAYYDATGTGNVRLKYNNSPTNPGTWVNLGAIDIGNGGENIDLKIDTDNAIHIAYYDNNRGDLRYIYIPRATATPTWIPGDVQKYIVDSYFDVGGQLTLELDSSNKPVIAYKGINRSGKVARLIGAPANGADAADQFTGSWDIAIVPTQINNTDSNRFNIGVDSSGLPVLGYTNGGLESIRLLSDLAD